jgi:O-antigen ligase
VCADTANLLLLLLTLLLLLLKTMLLLLLLLTSLWLLILQGRVRAPVAAALAAALVAEPHCRYLHHTTQQESSTRQQGVSDRKMIGRNTIHTAHCTAVYTECQ